MAGTVTLVSFGYGHDPAPEANVVVDVRHFKDPHVNRDLRYLDARNHAVMQAVMNMPGIPELVDSIAAMARAFRAGPVPGPVTIAIGCVGGRHRSAAVALAAQRRLQERSVKADVSHRDIDRPVIERASATG